MGKTFIGVRGVEESVFRKFRAASVEENIRLGDALSDAMVKWIGRRKEKAGTEKRATKLKPFDWGKGTERASAEVDEVLYGGPE